jgi:predicted GNAT superfamily acetyltransferase
MSTETERSTIVIRDIDSPTELRAVEGLQKEVWGLPDLDVVPLSQLVAAKAAGGVLVGAFDGDAMVGFIYGFCAFEHGQPAHHSHMLAVKAEYRNCNLGYRLKFAQRDRVLAQGIRIMTWTFDPLQSLNAYFNFNKLGLVANRYLVNFYGEDAPSFLHRNGTDRLWVTWPLEKTAEQAQREVGRVLPLVEIGADDSPNCNQFPDSLSGENALIEIPADINALQKRNPNLASVWRDATRWAFTKAIESNYLVVDFVRKTGGGNPGGTYVLSRAKTLADYLA